MNQFTPFFGMPRLLIPPVWHEENRLSLRDVRTKGLAIMFVMCELRSMDSKLTTTDLANRSGISMSYASEIMNGRKPNRPLAIHIMRTTGWRHPSLAGLSDEQIKMLETIEPWTPKAAA
jgi:transcriptional regulator with XRE-family HTH domain